MSHHLHSQTTGEPVSVTVEDQHVYPRKHQAMCTNPMGRASTVPAKDEALLFKVSQPSGTQISHLVFLQGKRDQPLSKRSEQPFSHSQVSALTYLNLPPERDSAQIDGLEPGRLYDISLVAEKDSVRSLPATVQATPGEFS
ncbi:hypothetical protein QQF64_013539 [Cirrhinus molitorella]|uniref:Uncharacterized protein n=1 Tax=Cirrhinus molitorella TaxID=172907 RepID=A0ABR3LRI7_9TELE